MSQFYDDDLRKAMEWSKLEHAQRNMGYGDDSDDDLQRAIQCRWRARIASRCWCSATRRLRCTARR